MGDDRYVEALRRFSGDLRMARQVFDSMIQRDVEIRPEHWRLYLDAHLDHRDVGGAREVIARMQDAGVDAPQDARWRLAIAASRAGQLDAALELLDELHQQGAQPDVEHAPAVLSVYVAAARFAAARSVLRRMASHGIAASDDDYARLLEDCLQRRAIKDTLSVVALMIDVGRPPQARRAAALVTMMARAGQPDRGRELAEMLRAAHIELSAGVDDELLLAYAKAGDTEQAQAVLDTITARGAAPSSLHHNALLQARLAANDAVGAWESVRRLTADGCIPTGANLEGLLEVSLAAGDVADASGVLDWMLILGVPVPPQAAAKVLGAHLGRGELDLGLSLARTLQDAGVPVDRRIARDLVERLAKAKRLDEAATTLESFRAAGRLTHGKHYGSLLTGYLGTKRPDDAVALLEHMFEHKLAPTSADASRVVGALVRLEQLDRARTLIGLLAEHAVSVDEPTYRELMWAYAKKGAHGPARAVYDAMVAAGITADERHDKALEWASGQVRRRLDDETDVDHGAAHAPGDEAARDQDGDQAAGEGPTSSGESGEQAPGAPGEEASGESGEAASGEAGEPVSGESGGKASGGAGDDAPDTTDATTTGHAASEPDTAHAGIADRHGDASAPRSA